MTDRDHFESMLTSMDYEYTVEHYGTRVLDNEHVIIFVPGGYNGFYTAISFDAAGKFTSIGAYE